jgi:hypothetical protein
MRRFLKTAFILTILLTSWSCKEDEEQVDAPEVKIKATLNLRNVNGTLSSRDWSLFDVSATRQNGNITISGFDNQAGEIFSLRVPDEGAVYYTNLGSDDDLGFASWRKNTNAITWYSNAIGQNELGDFVVEIDEINESTNTLSGTFFTIVHSPENEVENGIFQDGSFSNVPIVVSVDNDEITETKLSCKVNGINFNPTSVAVTQNEDEPFLNINATNSSMAILKIAIPLNAVDLDEFTVGTGNNETLVSYQQPPFDSFPVLNGVVTVETHNQGTKTMSGIFEFEVGEFGTPNYTITEGDFELIYD